MRRSNAPSVRNGKRQSEPLKSVETKRICKSDGVASTVNLDKRLKGDKLAFNVMWREQSSKKRKTWLGNGVLEVHLENGRAVLTDDAGKYLGSTDKFKVAELIEGFQMRVGNKEIEVQDQIVDQNEYWQMRKLQVENRGWGSEEWMPPEESAKPANKAMAKMSVPKLNLTVEHAKGKSIKEHTVTLPILTQTASKENNCDRSLKISDHLASLLRPHQREGVIFLYKCLIGKVYAETSFRSQSEYFGCILADEMGLGKTLQVLTVANSLIRYTKPQPVQRVLIVAPRSLVGNWNNEICKWLQAERMYGFVVDGNNSSKNRHKLSSYAKQPHVPFVIVSYETLVSQLQDFETLGFDLLICDEGHRIKNPQTKTYQALKALNVKRCVLLSGTPVQNVLSEFFVLADFVNPGILGTHSQFRSHFEMPLELDQLPQATAADRSLADERSAELKAITSTFLLRRLQNVNQKHLPTKHEYICLLCPSNLQHQLLRKFQTFYSEKEATPLELISLARKICNHPCLLKHAKQSGPLAHSLSRYVRDLHKMDAAESKKLLLVHHLLLTAIGVNSEKAVIVSYHTKTLDVLQKLCDNLNLKYLRLDGNTSTSERETIVSKFNAPNPNAETDAFVLLLSAKAGGVGLNLIGASRLILYDIDWNPANDVQALSRIWREGQNRDVHIYRLITAGCIEEKIFKRQITKANLGEFMAEKENETVNGFTTSMKFTPEELKDLFHLQYNYNVCETHEILKCECIGNGQNLSALSTSDCVKQFNELSGWKHWNPVNADETFMKDACLSAVRSELVFIFSTDNAYKKP